MVRNNQFGHNNEKGLKNHIATRANTFTSSNLSKLLDEGLLGEPNPMHLRSKVCDILDLYGMFRLNEILKITVVLITDALGTSTPGNLFDVDYPWPNKTHKTGFCFSIPEKYCATFQFTK